MRRIELEAGIAEQRLQRRQECGGIGCVQAQRFAGAEQHHAVDAGAQVRGIDPQPGMPAHVVGIGAGFGQARDRGLGPAVRQQREMPAQLRGAAGLAVAAIRAAQRARDIVRDPRREHAGA